MRAHFVIYTKDDADAGKDNAHVSYTDKYQEHIACIYGYKVVYIYDRVSKKHLQKELIMSKGIEGGFGEANKCLIFNELDAEKDIRVKDHCHVTGFC